MPENNENNNPAIATHGKTAVSKPPGAIYIYTIITIALDQLNNYYIIYVTKEANTNQCSQISRFCL